VILGDIGHFLDFCEKKKLAGVLRAAGAHVPGAGGGWFMGRF
jgi:hypothetical protein